MVDPDQVRFILYEERAIYSIGEPIRPKLQILNNTSQKIEFRKSFIFDWENLAFAEPNFIHLIGPDGAELTQPYHRDQSYFNSINSIIVDAGNEEWLYLPLYAHLHLREPGEYTFWLELHDNKGNLYQSNQLSFQLVDVESNLSDGLVELTMQSPKKSFAALETVELNVVFNNKSDVPLIFLKPQQDSFYGWVNPVYQFTVEDKASRTLALALRSGTMAIPLYDEGAKFTIAPRELFQQTLRLPVFSEMRNPGEYRVWLTYIVRENAIGKGGTLLDKKMNWEEGMFVGRIESYKTMISIK